MNLSVFLFIFSRDSHGVMEHIFIYIIESLDKELNSKDSDGMGDIVDNDDVWKNIDFNKNTVYEIV